MEGGCICDARRTTPGSAPHRRPRTEDAAAQRGAQRGSATARREPAHLLLLLLLLLLHLLLEQVLALRRLQLVVLLPVHHARDARHERRAREAQGLATSRASRVGRMALW